MTTGRINQVLQTLAVILGHVLARAWALVSGATFRRFDSRRADVLETGDIGGD